MNHTDFNAAHKAIESLAKAELIAALNAYGGEYIASDYDEEGNPQNLIIAGGFMNSEYTVDILFTRANVDEYGRINIFGKPYNTQHRDEEKIVFLEYGYIQDILSFIPETKLLKDTRNESQTKLTLQKVKEALNP